MHKKQINTSIIGKSHEQNACQHMEQNGFTILARNYRNKYGEIDIIAKKDNVIHFIEVKHRSNPSFLSISNYQIQRIENAAKLYMQTSYNTSKHQLSFDVVYTSKYKIMYMPNCLVNF